MYVTQLFYSASRMHVTQYSLLSLVVRIVDFNRTTQMRTVANSKMTLVHDLYMNSMLILAHMH